MKLVLGLLGVFVIGLVVYFMLPAADKTIVDTQAETQMADDSQVMQQAAAERMEVTEGLYKVLPSASTLTWAGKKPLVSGYINSGSIAITDGDITVTDGLATGAFIIDMNTLSVSQTPAKPGQESALEGHLQGERWFDVAQYPTASFEITKVTPRADSDTTRVYDVTGNLTMKGATDELSFPAEIYVDDMGMLRAIAGFEFDRTKWGITAGSGSFFDNLADNVVDDMVALSFSLVAEQL